MEGPKVNEQSAENCYLGMIQLKGENCSILPLFLLGKLLTYFKQGPKKFNIRWSASDVDSQEFQVDFRLSPNFNNVAKTTKCSTSLDFSYFKNRPGCLFIRTFLLF